MTQSWSGKGGRSSRPWPIGKFIDRKNFGYWGYGRLELSFEDDELMVFRRDGLHRGSPKFGGFPEFQIPENLKIQGREAAGIGTFTRC